MEQMDCDLLLLAGAKQSVEARTLHHGVDRAHWMLQLRDTAYDLVRLPKLLATP